MSYQGYPHSAIASHLWFRYGKPSSSVTGVTLFRDLVKKKEETALKVRIYGDFAEKRLPKYLFMRAGSGEF